MRLPVKLPKKYIVGISLIVLLIGGYLSNFIGDKSIECETTSSNLVCFKENKLRSLVRPQCIQSQLKGNISHEEKCSKVILNSSVKESTCKIVSNCTFD